MNFWDTHYMLRHADTRKAPETRRHMQIHAQLSIRAYTCRNMSCPQCMKVHPEPFFKKDTCRYTQSPWNTPTHAHACSAALNMWQHMKMPTLYLVHANTCSYKQSLLYRPFNVAGASVLTHAETWSCIPCSWKVRTRADTRSAPNAGHHMLNHGQS